MKNKSQNKNKQKGFTLTEVMIVVTISILVLGTAVSAFVFTGRRGRDISHQIDYNTEARNLINKFTRLVESQNTFLHSNNKGFQLIDRDKNNLYVKLVNDPNSEMKILVVSDSSSNSLSNNDHILSKYISTCDFEFGDNYITIKATLGDGDRTVTTKPHINVVLSTQLRDTMRQHYSNNN